MSKDGYFGIPHLYENKEALERAVADEPKYGPKLKPCQGGFIDRKQLLKELPPPPEGVYMGKSTRSKPSAKPKKESIPEDALDLIRRLAETERDKRRESKSKKESRDRKEKRKSHRRSRSRHTKSPSRERSERSKRRSSSRNRSGSRKSTKRRRASKSPSRSESEDSQDIVDKAWLAALAKPKA